MSGCVGFECRGFDGREQVVGATCDLACDGEPGAATAAALRGARVEVVIGARASAAVGGCFDERPAQIRGALLREPASASTVGGLDHSRVEPACADHLP